MMAVTFAFPPCLSMISTGEKIKDVIGWSISKEQRASVSAVHSPWRLNNWKGWILLLQNNFGRRVFLSFTVCIMPSIFLINLTMQYFFKQVTDKNHSRKMITLGIGFGDLSATAENIPPGSEELKLPEAVEMFVKASNCCASLCNHCCCMCCIEVCSKMNNQCAIALTQLCTAVACFGCIECWASVCCSGSDGR